MTPETPSADRERILGLLRDFRLLAVAFNAESPSWVDSLENLVDPGRTGLTSPTGRALLTGDPEADRRRLLTLIQDFRLMSALFHSKTPAWLDSLEALIDPGKAAGRPSTTPLSAPTPGPEPPLPTAIETVVVPPAVLPATPVEAPPPNVIVTTEPPGPDPVSVPPPSAEVAPPEASAAEPPAAPRFFPRITQRLQAMRRPSRPTMLAIALPETAEAAAPVGQATLVAVSSAPADDEECINLGELHPTAAPTIIVRNAEDLNQAIPTPAEPAAAAEPDEAHAANLAQTYFRKGESYQRQRDFKRAVACYTEAVRRCPRFVPALLERGQIYRLARKPERAIPDFNAALEVDPSNTEAYIRRGNTLADQGRHEEAIDDYTAAIALAPDNAVAYLNRALAHAKRQDNAKVLEDASAALGIDADLALAYLLRGTAYSNRNSHELALADLNRAVQIEPQNALAYNERGLALVRKGNYPQAVLNYSKALALAPTLHIARFNRALAHRLHGDYPIAIAEFSAFVEQQPRVAEGYYQRGLAARANGELAGAIQDFDTALTLRPGHAEYVAARMETQQDSLDRGEPAASAPGSGAAPVSPPVAAGAARVTASRSPRSPYRPRSAPVATRQDVHVRMDLPERLRRLRFVAAITSVAAAVVLVAYVGFTFSDDIFAQLNAPRTVAAQGTVLVRGRGLEGVRVTFHPQFDTGAVKYTPTGTTDARGKFILSTGASNDGAPPGEYLVTFERTVVEADRKRGIEMEVDAWRGKYSDPAASKWKVEVKPDAPLDFQLD